MRTIKFRVWTRLGEWDSTGEKRNFIMIDADSLCFTSSEPLKDQLKDIDDEFYLMQFTELIDKNGKEIYEGDILNDGSIIKYCQECFSFQPHYFDRNEYVCHSCEGNYNWFDLVNFREDYELIGNIYENPELLNDENN